MDPRLKNALVSLTLPALLVALHFGARFLPERPPRLWRSFRRWWLLLARRPILGAAILGAIPLSACLYYAILNGPPIPFVHDEFSYMLAAKTFAAGRLTNTAHPMWVHFESFHILQVPTYMSMYPPLQGLFLALGLLAGHAWIGVLFSTLLAIVLIWWAARQWLPPRWALCAGLFGALLFTGTYWSLSYWGGAAATVAGALVTGSAGVLRRRPSPTHFAIFALGIVLCANSRPYEGLILCGAFAIWLVWHILSTRSLTARLGSVAQPLADARGSDQSHDRQGVVLCRGTLAGGRKPRRTAGFSYLRASLPALLVLAGGALMTMSYFKAVTGNPFRMPYQEAVRQYFGKPVLNVGTQAPQPTYRHEVLRRVYTYRPDPDSKPLSDLYYGVRRMQYFYLGEALFVLFPLALLILGRSRRRAPICIAFIGGAAMIVIPYAHPHYFAPFAACYLLAVCESLRHLAVLSFGGRPGGWVVVTACLVVIVGLLATRPGPIRQLGSQQSSEYARQRLEIERRLIALPDEDLVFVRYQPDHIDHQEWVYNHADIDASAVVWARAMDPVNDRSLRSYFASRRAWIVDADAKPPRLSPYPESAASASPFPVR